jgi:hypothetical protein
MTTRKTKTTGRGVAKKLKLKKETIRDLDAKGAGRGVKAGWGPVYPTLACPRRSGNCTLVASICYVAPITDCPC